MECSDNRGASFGLDRDHFWTVTTDPTHLPPLIKCFPHPDQAGSTAGGVENRVGKLPAKLFRELIAHCLLSFDPVRLLQRRHVKPSFSLLAFGDYSAA